MCQARKYDGLAVATVLSPPCHGPRNDRVIAKRANSRAASIRNLCRSFPRLIVEPDDGVDPVRELISSAQNSLLIKQFTFTEEILIQAVIERRNAGVDVRVMLNPARSGGDRANDETFERFSEAGITVRWSNPKFYVTHEKSIVADDRPLSSPHSISARNTSR